MFDKSKTCPFKVKAIKEIFSATSNINNRHHGIEHNYTPCQIFCMEPSAGAGHYVWKLIEKFRPNFNICNIRGLFLVDME